MPPRHTYWTIIFGNQPTAFRSATREDLLPTFRQIQAKHPDAVMMWFARGRLWRSEEEARDAFFARRDRPRESKPQWRDRPPRPHGDKLPWRDRPREGERQNAFRGPKPAWKDRPPGQQSDRPFKPKDRWRDRPPGDRPWGNRPPRAPHGSPPGSPPGPPPGPPKPRSGEGGKPRTGEGGKPRSGEGGKPRSREGGRGRDWRPGGDHKDPRDRFKVPRDVKRARFKAKLRHDRTRPPKKRDDEK